MPFTVICNTIGILFQLVDAVITEDGDAFLYGARTVYKNFTTTKVFITNIYIILFRTWSADVSHILLDLDLRLFEYVLI